MNAHIKIDELKQQGFFNLGSSLLSQIEIKELCTLSKKIIESIPPSNPDYMSAQSGAGGVMRLPQHHPRVAELLDRVITNREIKLVLEALLGPGYKIWQVNMRRSSVGDRGLYLHQDAPGEVGLCVLLSDNLNGSGATVFLPGSHLVSRRMKDLRVAIPPFLLTLLRSLFTPLIGKAGDVSLFFNRTWHGRFSNRSTKFYDVIFFSFFPAGHYLGYEGYGEWSAEFLLAIQETELGRLINPHIGTERQSDGRYKILCPESSTKRALPFALAIETNQGRRHCLNYYRLSAFIILLQLIIRFIEPLALLFRKLNR